MRKITKTYGIYHLSEWDVILSTPGGVSLRVHFEGGAAHISEGARPATFTTSGTVEQYIIENSQEFLSRRIVLLRSFESEDNEEEDDEEVSNEGSSNEESQEETSGDASLTDMHFTSRDDAKDYLMQHFGVAPEALTKKASIIKQGKANGLNITIEE